MNRKNQDRRFPFIGSAFRHGAVHSGACTLAVLTGIVLLMVEPSMAQTHRGVGTGDDYVAARTADGQPDLQGIWTNSTYTPLERPEGISKSHYDEDEYEEMLRKRASSERSNVESGPSGDVHYDKSQFGLDRSQNQFAKDSRTSLIIDPPDGRVPDYTPAGAARARAAIERHNNRAASIENMTMEERCLAFRGSGPPMLDPGYNNNMQIVQVPGYVMILVEMFHEVRIIPLTNIPHPHENVKRWHGSARGHWEGETLVVDTTNFNGRNPVRELVHQGRGSSENLKVTERFTRIADDTILYSFTVTDEDTWVAPWTAEIYLQRSTGPIFEAACHEGNDGVYNALLGQRIQEQERAAKD